MKTGRSIQDLAAEIARQSKSRKDYIAPTTKLTAVVEDYGGTAGVSLAGLNGAPLGIRPLAHGQIAQDLDIPKRYYDRMLGTAPELLTRNLNHWLAAQERPRLVRTLDGSARAWLSNKYRRLDNFDLIEACLPVLLEAGCTIESCEVTERRLYLKAVLFSMTAEVRRANAAVGDVVAAGVCLSNSEVGEGRLLVQPMIEVLKCKNGATFDEGSLKKLHVGKAFAAEDAVYEILTDEAKVAADRAFWLATRDVTKAALSETIFNERVAVMQAAAGRGIERGASLEKVVELAGQKLSLNLGGGEARSIMQHLTEGGDLTQYGLHNALTRHSQDVEDYDRATEFERAGGRVLELAPTDWKALSTAGV